MITRSIFKILFSLLLLAATINTNGQATIDTSAGQYLNFQQLASYLSEGSGHWESLNPNYDEQNPRSAKSYSLVFEYPLKHLLKIRILVQLKNAEVLSAEGMFSWNPLTNSCRYVMVDRGNGYMEGVSEFPDSTTFITTTTVFRPNGQKYEHKDENFVMSKDVHRNSSYRKDREGNWILEGNFQWKRKLN